MGAHAAGLAEIVIAENVAATERVLHLEPRDPARGIEPPRSREIAAALRSLGESRPDLTGITLRRPTDIVTLAGSDSVADTADAVFGGAAPIPGEVTWRRRAAAFFQGNRFLLGALVARVLDQAPGDRVVDLYAGVGLFSVALAARGSSVMAVEGEPVAAADLRNNATPFIDRLEPIESGVERVVSRPLRSPLDAAIVDPPRTGLSPAALDGIAGWAAPRIVYVSCDPPTLARDAGRLRARGYELQSLAAFDLFPNTSHIETVATFQRR
jgi:tRNA/tmRNA/rRNA uracil-C5-methylase (TrmA/RlmC/RlmD family)